MSDMNSGQEFPPLDGPGDTVPYPGRDFWRKQNLKHTPAHYRLQKSARLITRLAGERECDLLDVGCGPATLMRLLPKNVHYYGIDIAIQSPAQNLIEVDILETPIRFGDRQFDIIVAFGLFEYVGGLQAQKFIEIAQLLKKDGTFIVSYTNFGHRQRNLFWAYSNVQPIDEFKRSLERCFEIRRVFPASHNWNHGQPYRKLVRAANMHVNSNIPYVSPRLAVEYFFICSLRDTRGSKARAH